MKRGSEGQLSFWAGGLHLFVLWAFAITQPVLDLLGRSPEFFIAHRSQLIDLWAMALVLSVGPPSILVACEAVSALVGNAARRALHGFFVAALLAAIALPILKRAAELPAEPMLALAALFGVGLAAAYLRASVVRRYASVLAPVVLVFPALFLMNGSVRSAISPERSGALVPVSASRPVVLIIFDELPLTSLLDPDGQLDSDRAPHFAELARDGIWLRNATTVSDVTQRAIPSILSGLYPDPDRDPTAADYPNNLFTLLGASYRMNVSEGVFLMCPTALCGDDRGSLRQRIGPLAVDVSMVAAHLVLPDEWAERLPPISQNWQGFARRNNEWLQHFSSSSQRDRSRQFDEFVAGIQSGEPPTLHFLHILLPHAPFEYLPSGRVYSYEVRIDGLDDGVWTDSWAATQSYQRHLLQVGYADRLLGRVVAKLKQAELYDEVVLVVTADHGTSFRKGEPRRHFSETNFHEIMAVPLLVKAAGSVATNAEDRLVETIDILPTVADALGVKLPWPIDGVSIFDSESPPRTRSRIHPKHQPGEVFAYDRATLGAAVRRAVRRRIELFGASSDEEAIFRVGDHGDLVGRAISELEVLRDPELEIDASLSSLSADVDLDGGFVPSHIRGAVRGVADSEPVHIAVAVNGVIRAVTRSRDAPTAPNGSSWSTVVSEGSFREQANAVEGFLVRPSGANRLLIGGLRSAAINSYGTFGGQRVHEIPESGFYAGKAWGGMPVRWTNGHAMLTVPVSGSPPSELEVDLVQNSPSGTELRVVVNGVSVFEGHLEAGGWTQRIGLEGVLVSDEARIELHSGTFVPREVTPGSRDRRTLGVAVRGVRFVYESDADARG